MELALVFNNPQSNKCFFKISLLIPIETETKVEVSTMAQSHSAKFVKGLGTLLDHVGIDLTNHLLLSPIEEDNLLLVKP